MVQAQLRLLEAATRVSPSFALLHDERRRLSHQAPGGDRETLRASDRELIRVKYRLTGPDHNGDAGFVERYHFRAGHSARRSLSGGVAAGPPLQPVAGSSTSASRRALPPRFTF